MADPVYELHDDQLEDVAKVLNLLHAGGQVGEGPVLIRVDEHHEGVPLQQQNRAFNTSTVHCTAVFRIRIRMDPHKEMPPGSGSKR